MSDWLPLEQAQGRIVARVAEMAAEEVALAQSCGRVLAEGLVAPSPVPAFDNSAMDGYAVRWSDAVAGESLPVVLAVAAGSAPGVLPEGSAARIFTGGVMPQGADTVVVQEDARLEGDQVRFTELPQRGRGANVRHAGSYVERGVEVLRAGDPVGAGEQNLMATLGVAQVAVRSRPRVAVISTGSELVPLGETPQPGQIVDSTSVMLASMIEAAGGVSVPMPIVGDDYGETKRAFEQAIDTADLVVSMGGVSVGDHDLVRPVMGALCDALDFWKVQMKPGKPLAFGVARDGTGLIGLPGNPVSSWVGFWQFVRPAIRKALGCPSLFLPQRRVTVGAKIASTPRRLDLVRGRLVHSDGSTRFVCLPRQSSADPTSIVGVDALGRVPVGISTMDIGEEIEVDLIVSP